MRQGKKGQDGTREKIAHGVCPKESSGTLESIGGNPKETKKKCSTRKDILK